MSDFQLGPGPLTPEFEQVKSDIGIVENSNTATHAIPAGYYVIWKGDLYVAKTDISSGAALSTSNLQAKTQGIGADVGALNSILLALLSAGASETFMNVDANDYKTGGTYYFATGCTNVPGAYFLCLVFQHRSDFSIQIGLRAAEKDKLYFRCFSSNTWGNWNELALNSNLNNLIPQKLIDSSVSSIKTINLPNNARANIDFICNATTYCFSIIVWTNSSGAVNILEKAKGDAVVFDTSVNGKISIEFGSSGRAGVFWVQANGWTVLNSITVS